MMRKSEMKAGDFQRALHREECHVYLKADAESDGSI